MKVLELLEQRQPAALSAVEFAALSPPSAKNIDDRYTVDGVAFDTSVGLGAVPNNQDVRYLGFVVEMTPSDFLHLAAMGDRGETADQLVPLIKQKVPLGPPMLKLNVHVEDNDKKPLAIVASHEGRGRMVALQKLGLGSTKFPVHITLNSGLRAHSLNEKFFEKLRDEGIVPEDFDSLGAHEVDFGRIFWKGKEL